MTTAMMELERIHKSSKEDVKTYLSASGMTLNDNHYLAAIQIPTGIIEVQGVATAASLPTKSLRLYHIDEGPTGYFQSLGGARLVFLNEHRPVDYDTISELHTVPDADVYLAITAPWEAGRDVPFEQLKEWYRDETYLDHFREVKVEA